MYRWSYKSKGDINNTSMIRSTVNSMKYGKYWILLTLVTFWLMTGWRVTTHIITIIINTLCKYFFIIQNFSYFSGVLNTSFESALDEEVNSRPLLSGKHGDHSSASNSGNKHQEYVTMVPVATSGACYNECQMIFPFMILLFFMTLFVAVTQMPVLMLVLRWVR